MRVALAFIVIAGTLSTHSLASITSNRIKDGDVHAGEVQSMFMRLYAMTNAADSKVHQRDVTSVNLAGFEALSSATLNAIPKPIIDSFEDNTINYYDPSQSSILYAKLSENAAITPLFKANLTFLAPGDGAAQAIKIMRIVSVSEADPLTKTNEDFLVANHAWPRGHLPRTGEIV